MSLAYEEALKAEKENEVPVGAVIVKDQQVISRAYNKKEQDQQAVSHAEILAIRQASLHLNNWRLDQCSLYTTLEPCLMCAGAIGSARIQTLIYACCDPKMGAVQSHLKVLDHSFWNHRVQVVSGVLSQPSSQLLTNFFKHIRRNKTDLLV